MLEKTGTCAALDDKPEIYFDLLPYWEAFSRLSSSRSFGASGIGNPIPFGEIKAYLEMFPFPDPDHFIEVVQAMDGVYVQHCVESKKSQ